MTQLTSIPKLFVLGAALAFLACGAQPAPSPEETEPVETLTERANRLAQETLIIDTHVDVPYRLIEKEDDISLATESGDFDYPRAKAGGLDAPFMSIYIPASYEESGGARAFADELIDMVEGFEANAPEKFTVARSRAEVLAAFEAGKIALPMGLENGTGIEDDLANLEHFHQRGIRYITLTHGENNLIGDSSYAAEKQWEGLSPFGREVVVEMNRLGIMVDISHVSDPTAEDVLELSTAPVIASHSSCRRFTPDWERNMSDELIQKLAEKQGVIQINFGSGFLREDAQKAGSAKWATVVAFAKENGYERGDPEITTFMEEYSEEHPTIFANLDDVVAHIDHVVQLVGVDYVGLGSDFDGVGDSLPEGLKDVSAYPNLIARLLEKGYSEEDVAKILGGNLMRVWAAVDQVAEKMQASTPS